MNKIKQVFENGKAFIGFLTAGDPDAESTVRYILEMEKAGADRERGSFFRSHRGRRGDPGGQYQSSAGRYDHGRRI